MAFAANLMRSYPHRFNVDGFFVSKFQKTGPTPPNAVGAPDSIKANGKGSTQPVDEVIDRTPITDDENKEDSDFGDWDSDEDRKYIQRAEKSELRRKGKNPKAIPGNAKQGPKTSQNGEKATLKSEPKKSGASNGTTEGEIVSKDLEDGAAKKKGSVKEKKSNSAKTSAKRVSGGGEAGGAESKPRKTNGERKK